MNMSYSEKHQQRMAGDVLAKIKRVYGLSDDALGLEEIYRH